MLFIKEVSKKNQEVKVIYSLERPDIEFIWNIETIKNAIKKGHEYKTVYTEDNKLVEGAEVIISGYDYLTTKQNHETKDNLSELPTF